MLLSKSCVYAIRAVLYIALNSKDGKYLSIRDVADELQISFHFLTKILQQLTQEKILTSYRGPNGGIALGRPGRDINLLDIIRIVDGPDLFEKCVLGLPGCGTGKPCPLHDSWGRDREQIRDTFASMNLEELANNTRNLGLRLTIEN
jgi:Rrf2 family iron-sulfur cluster assembly transcriptional regulator